MRNIVLAGVGGQGTVLASKILAQSAIRRGECVHTAETIGMAQRGGSVVSHVRIGGDSSVVSPLIPRGKADVLISFEAAEACRNLPLLKKGGYAIVSDTVKKPVTDALAETDYTGEAMLAYLKTQDVQLVIVPGDEITKECGSVRVLNMALLGAAAVCGAIGLSMEEICVILGEMLPEKHVAMNEKALRLGGRCVLPDGSGQEVSALGTI